MVSYYIFEFITVITISVVMHLNIKEPNMSTFKCINLLLFTIPCFTANNNSANVFESDYNTIF